MGNLNEHYLILIADDDRRLIGDLRDALQRNGYNVYCAYDSEETLHILGNSQPQLLLVGDRMPGLNGVDFCREIRKTSTVPLIMMGADPDEFDIVLGIEMGADDYLRKSLSLREICVRIKSLLRRAYHMEIETARPAVTDANISIDTDDFTVTVAGVTYQSSPKELTILEMLISNANRAVSRREIMHAICGTDYEGDMRAVDNHIKRIRAKYCREGNDWTIETVRAVGYRFVAKLKSE